MGTVNVPNLAHLLEHERFVRAVAARLTASGAAQDAEDVAQQVWLAAAAGGLRRPGRARAWLAAVARNAASKLRAAGAARGRRERAAARPEREPATADLVVRLDASRRVADAVLALDAPLREAVLLRWYEGLTPAAAARRAGVPVETFRSRLKRAYAALRARLEPDFGGRTGCAAALVALADAPGRTPRFGGGEALAMTTKSKTVAAACVAILAAVAAWKTFADGSSGGERPEPVGPVAAPVASEAGAAGRAASRPESAGAIAAAPFADAPASAPAAPTDGALRIRCAWSDGAPAVDVPFRAEWSAPGTGAPAFAVRTDGGGELAFRSAPGKVRLACELAAGGGDYDVVAGRTTEARLTLRAEAQVRGRTLDAAGAAVPGAVVRLVARYAYEVSPEVARADAEGRFRIAGVRRDADLFAEAPGRAPTPLVSVSEVADARGAADVVLRFDGAGGALRGRATTADGAPAAGAAVSVELDEAAGRDEREKLRRKQFGPPRLRTGALADATGAFAVEGLAPGPVAVVVTRPGSAPWRRTLEIVAGGVVEVDVRLAAAAAVDGLVLDAAGAPAAGAEVSLAAPGVAERLHLRADAAGTFRAEDLAAGAAEAHAFVAGSGYAKEEVVLVAGARTRVVLRLGAAAVVGRVVDERGAPVTNVAVRATAAGGDVPMWIGVRPNARGEFTIAEPRWSRLLVEATDPLTHAPLARVDDVPVGGPPLELRIPDAALPSAFVVGALTDADGAPLTGASLSVGAEGSELGHGGEVAPETGAFKLGPLKPGPCRLFARGRDGVWRLLGSRTLLPRETWDLGTVRCGRAARLRATLRGDSGGTGPSMAAASSDATPFPLWFDARAAEPTELAPGDYVVWFPGDGARAAAFGRVSLTEGEERTLELARPAAAVRKFACDPPRSWGFRVRVVGPEGSVLADEPSDKAGVVSLALPAGRWTLEVDTYEGRRVRVAYDAPDAAADAPTVLAAP